MGATPRVDVAGEIYHAYNRSVGGATMFVRNSDYRAFEEILVEARGKVDVQVLAYCLMPNHWHFVLKTNNDGDLARFFHWLTLTHVTRWQAVHGVTGSGHLYQGTFKSNLCAADEHFLTLVRYVERNAAHAGLVEKAQDWRWGSAWLRFCGTPEQKKFLSPWPMDEPNDYLKYLNTPLHEEKVRSLCTSILRGAPFGGKQWSSAMVENHHLEQTVRPRGRPRKK